MGEGEGEMIWENDIEICIISYETSRQSRFDARYWMLGAGDLGRPRGMVWGGRRDEGSGWGTRVCLWQIHFHIFQNRYNIIKFKNKIKLKKKKKKKKLSTEELMLLNCGAGELSLRVLALQGDPINQSQRK